MPSEPMTGRRQRRMGGERQTGRTTEAIQEAMATAHTGKTVLFVAADVRQANDVRERLGSTPNVTVVASYSLPIGRRYHRVVCDHFVYECLLNSFDAKLDALESVR